MKQTTRILALLLALAMVFGLVACGAKTPEAAAPEAAAPEAAAPATTEVAKLKWYVCGDPQTDVATVASAISQYVNETYGMNIELEMVTYGWGDYDTKMQMAIASGEEFDLCYTADWLNNYYSNVAKNAFLPLDDLIAEYGQDMAAVIPEALFDATKVNGQIYAVPNWQIESREYDVIIDKAFVDEFGLDVSAVKDLKDLAPFFAAVSDKYDIDPLQFTAAIFPYLYLDMGFVEISSTSVPGVIKYSGSDYTVYNQFESEEYMEMCKLMYNWASNDIINDGSYTITYPQCFADGVHIATIDPMKPGEDITWQNNMGGKEVVCIPLSERVMSTSAVVATLTAISRTSENPEVAMQFLNLVNTDATLFNMICFGLEGVHYTLNADGTTTSIDGAGYNPNTDWAFGNQFLAYPREGQSATIWEDTKVADEGATVAWTMGFVFNAEPVATEIASCSAVYEQYKQVEIGLIDPEVYIPEMVEKLKQAGSDTIVAEMQRQIDEWRANQ